MAIAQLPLQQPAPALSGIDPCATCGACCYLYYVPLSGYDVWRISRTLGLDPSEFVVAFANPPEAKYTFPFRLCHDGDPYELALEKQGPFQIGEPCVFLDRRDDGTSRCGIYDVRPAACRAYPMELTAENTMTMRPRALCPSGAWSDCEPEQPAWRASWASLATQFDQYRQVVEMWNAQVALQPDRQFSMDHYLAYVMGVYDKLASRSCSA
jgi:Fe-S-cluster containining protein